MPSFVAVLEVLVTLVLVVDDCVAVVDVVPQQSSQGDARNATLQAWAIAAIAQKPRGDH